MVERVCCARCSNMILVETSRENDGLCGVCVRSQPDPWTEHPDCHDYGDFELSVEVGGLVLCGGFMVTRQGGDVLKTRVAIDHEAKHISIRAVHHSNGQPQRSLAAVGFRLVIPAAELGPDPGAYTASVRFQGQDHQLHPRR